MTSPAKKETNPHFSVLALIFFMASFLVARTFTTLSPNTIILVGGGIHIHHFWFGLALLAIGGWMGIVNQNQRIDQLAAVLYGAGAGLIADEFGLLLTFGDYWTEWTYTIVIILVTLASIGILLVKYSRTIRTHAWGLSKGSAILYLGIFLGVVSVAFLFTANNVMIFDAACVIAVIALVMILIYVVQRLRSKPSEKKGKPTLR